jgi:apolipoprotein D and lipocalin family protein
MNCHLIAKLSVCIGISSLLLASAPALRAQSRPVQVVPSVDLTRYAGTWYEIARLPNRFQEFCAGDVLAKYTLLDDGEIRVVNSCRDAEGVVREAEGRARRQDAGGPDAKLEVRFAPAFLSFLPFVWGDYWIIDLAADYSYAVIGGPDREYLWILARSATLPDSTYAGITERLRDQGYEPNRLIITRHSDAGTP